MSYEDLHEADARSNKYTWYTRPKYRGPEHILIDTRDGVCRMNPIMFDCLIDEDFLGKLTSIGKYCRGGGPEATMLRLVQRYMLHLTLRWHNRQLKLKSAEGSLAGAAVRAHLGLLHLVYSPWMCSACLLCLRSSPSSTLEMYARQVWSLNRNALVYAREPHCGQHLPKGVGDTFLLVRCTSKSMCALQYVVRIIGCIYMGWFGRLTALTVQALHTAHMRLNNEICQPESTPNPMGVPESKLSQPS